MLSQNTPQIVEHVNYQTDYSVYDVKWVDTKSQVIAVGELLNNKGVINIYDLKKGQFKSIAENIAASGIKTATAFYSHTGAYTVACGCFDGTLLLYDISNMTQPYYEVKRQERLINKVECKYWHNNTLVISAGRDGSVRIFDIRMKKEAVTLKASKDAPYIPDCWCVATGNNYISTNDPASTPEEHFNICAGYDNGDIKFFDMKMMAIEYEANVHNGVCSVSYDRKDTKQNKLICSTLEGNIFIFNLAIFSEEREYSFSKDKVVEGTCWGTHFLPQNRDIFACLGGDGNFVLYKYENPEQNFVFDEVKGYKKGVVGKIQKLNDLTVSSQPIISMDWNRQLMGLSVLASLDQTIKVYITTKLNTY